MCRALRQGVRPLLAKVELAGQPCQGGRQFQVGEQGEPSLTAAGACFLHQLPRLRGLQLRGSQSLHRLQGLTALRQLCITLKGCDTLEVEPIGCSMQGLTRLQLR